ncbi:MAG TPA: TIGR03067 domain-containing protein [Gemmataceae bacterium]|nr:TIGR03067 domain-containing protein [Gemmataceae bacterium]
MKRATLALLLGFSLISAAVAKPYRKPKSSETDLDRLQGTWIATEITVAGRKLPENEVTGTVLRCTKEGIEFRHPDRSSNAVNSYRLDPTRVPKAINLVPQGGRYKGAEFLGTYQLEGDHLILCCHDGTINERPAEFASPRGSTIVLMKLKRNPSVPNR